MITAKLKGIVSDTEKVSKDIQKTNERIDEIEDNVNITAESTTTLSEQLEIEKAKTNDIKDQIEETKNATADLAEKLKKETVRTDALIEIQDSERSMSSQLRALASNSKHFFEEPEDTEFVETSTYLEVKEKVDRTRFVVLSGHPGEGKSTMAKHLLMAKFTPERCLNIRDPTEWEHVDLNVVLNAFDAILMTIYLVLVYLKKHCFKSGKED